MGKKKKSIKKRMCKFCAITFQTLDELKVHIQSTPNHSANGKCDCDGCNPSLSKLNPKDRRRLYAVSRAPPKHWACEPCDRNIFLCRSGKKKHIADPLHVKNSKEKNIFCSDASKSFISQASFDVHLLHDHKEDMQYHCTECEKDFPSKCALKRHPKNDAAHGKRAMGILCEPCGKTFTTGSGYDAHLLTKAHKKAGKFKCFAYPKCTRKFSTKGGMMCHLESGACKSGLNRQKIDDVIRQHDTSNVILKVGAGSSSQTIQDAVPNHAPPVVAGSIKDIDSDSDSDDEGTIILTPATATSFSRRESFADIHTPSTLSGFATPQSYTTSSHQEIPTPSSTLSGYSTPRSYVTGFVDTEFPTSFSRRESFSDIPTPSSTLSGLSTPRSNITGFGETDLQFVFGPGFERICYVCNREFSTPKALQTHLDGLAHAPRIYKCPTFLFAAQHSGKPHKDFKSLSGLVMHLESGACEGGNEALQRAIGFVEEKLNGTGRGLLQM